MKKEQPIQKEEFAVLLNHQIEIYKNLINGLNICANCILEYHNKECITEFLCTIRAKGNPLKLLFKLYRSPGLEEASVCISDYHNRITQTKHIVSDHETIFVVNFVHGGMIDAFDTIKTINKQRSLLEQKIIECENDILLYDSAKAFQDVLNTKVKEYERKYSLRLRNSL